jgi:hypothetical protein
MKQEQLEGVMQLLRAKIDGTRKEIERAPRHTAPNASPKEVVAASHTEKTSQ